MKRFVLISILAGMLPLGLFAQDDDLYFTPTKDVSAQPSRSVKKQESQSYYGGSNRDVDEYNRHGKYWSHYQKIGSDNQGNDIIEFSKGNGVYPDSTYIDTTFVGRYFDTIDDGDDFKYTSRMSRWDGFYDPWFYSSWGYSPYWRAGWGWYSPWYDPWYYGYGGWYGAWYDPWYYGWGYPYYGYYGYYGWGRPWYGYYGWYDPWYYGGAYYSYGGPTGSRNHSYGNANFGGGSSTTASRFGGRGTYGTFGSRSGFSSNSSRSVTYSPRTFSGSTRTYTTNSSGARFGGNGSTRTYTPTSTEMPANRSYSAPSQSTRSFGGSSFGGGFGGASHSGGSFGGSRSGGFSGGGGGGGHFGGRR